MTLSLVVAMDRNRVIGRAGRLPWRLPDELQNFKRITMGKPIVMGRRTHESIGRPLPGRANIVVTRNPHYEAPGCRVVHSLSAALAASAGAGETLLIGGAALFEEALPLAARLYLTEIHAEVDGDVWFPEFDRGAWREVERIEHPADARHEYSHSLSVLDRAG